MHSKKHFGAFGTLGFVGPLRYTPPVHFVVLSSSRGSVFQATIDAMKSGTLTAVCAGLVTDRDDRLCIEKAKAAGLPYRVVEQKKNETREAYDTRVHGAVINLFEESSTRYPLSATRQIVACMGWMWILNSWFISEWKGRILNVHPALLPKHGGKGMYGHLVHEAVLAAREKESGMTIHLMDEGVDTGTVVLQKKCPVLPDDTVETLSARTGGLEREWYPKVLEMVERGELELS